jgi:hypothetical protein
MWDIRTLVRFSQQDERFYETNSTGENVKHYTKYEYDEHQCTLLNRRVLDEFKTQVSNITLDQKQTPDKLLETLDEASFQTL